MNTQPRTPTPTTMAAMARDVYGGPEHLSLRQLPTPAVGPDDVLVRVAAASLNKADHYHLRAVPWLIRLGGFGVFRPKYKVVGADLAGTVVALGANVTSVGLGDAVYADTSGGRWGAFGELAAVEEAALAKVPAALSLEQAAAVPMAAVTAHQALVAAGVAVGGSVLINGASGGVGTFAVQLAKALGAIVTAVCSTRNVDQARSLGADEVIDYRTTDVADTATRFNAIVDLVGNRSVRVYKPLLAEGGTYVLAGGSVGRIFRAAVLGPLITLLSKKKTKTFLAKPSGEALGKLQAYIDSGQVAPVIERSYPLDALPEAFSYLEEGHARGKLVVVMSDADTTD